MECEARLRGRELRVRAEALPERGEAPAGSLAFSPLGAMGGMIEPRAFWVRGRPRPHAETAG